MPSHAPWECLRRPSARWTLSTAQCLQSRAKYDRIRRSISFCIPHRGDSSQWKSSFKGQASKAGYDYDILHGAWDDPDCNGRDTRSFALARKANAYSDIAGTHDCIVLSLGLTARWLAPCQSVFTTSRSILYPSSLSAVETGSRY